MDLEVGDNKVPFKIFSDSEFVIGEDSVVYGVSEVPFDSRVFGFSGVS